MTWGLLSVLRGLIYLGRTPAAWPRAAVPGVLFLLLFAGFVAASLGWLRPALLDWLGASPVGSEAAPIDPGWAERGRSALGWLATVLAMALGALLALALTPPLAAPALEGLVERRERELGVPPRSGRGFWYELLGGIRAQAFGWLLFGPAVLGAWIVGVLFAPLAPLMTALSMTCTCLAVAWNLLDYPLTLRGIGARRRWRFLRRHLPTCLGFGAGFALLFWVPCFGVLLLPVGVVAATEVVWKLAAGDPEAPVELRCGAG